MRYLKSLFIPVLLILAFVMVACAPAVAPQPEAAKPTEAPAPSVEKIELVLRQNDPPTEAGDSFERAVADWNASHPNIHVTLENVPWADAQDQYVREVQAGGGPDVAQMAFVWTRDLAKSGLVMNLDSYIENDPPGTVSGMEEFKEDFLGWDLGEYKGSIYGIPFSVDTFAMGYRPDLFEAAGVKAFPDTWDELFDVAQKLTADIDGDGRTDQYGFCFQAGSGAKGGMWFLANYYLWSNGKWFIREVEGGGWEVGLTAEDVADAMNYFNSFFTVGATPESMIAIDSWGDPEYTSALGRGECAILFFPPAAFRAAEKQSEVPLRTAPDPRGSVTRISHLGGRTLVLNPNTKHPDEAWELLKFLTSQKWYEEYYTQQFPPQKSLLANMKFEESMQGYAEQLPHAVTFKTYIIAPPPVSAMWDATNREFGAVYSGQKTPEQASADLVATMQKLLETSK
ncbi:MAG TPA: sugar ABC transporter substrate-binding protein [Anaerolineae bacterium]|nr:sugar ABC transporter substrate-binding protein [Anaerolineae bacterium]